MPQPRQQEQERDALSVCTRREQADVALARTLARTLARARARRVACIRIGKSGNRFVFLIVPRLRHVRRGRVRRGVRAHVEWHRLVMPKGAAALEATPARVRMERDNP